MWRLQEKIELEVDRDQLAASIRKQDQAAAGEDASLATLQAEAARLAQVKAALESKLAESEAACRQKDSELGNMHQQFKVPPSQHSSAGLAPSETGKQGGVQFGQSISVDVLTASAAS